MSVVGASRSWSLPAERDTIALGAMLARAMPNVGGRALYFTLRGELGAGKTTFARGFLQALGVAGPVRSPSYALLEIYELAQGRALHLDLYRLRDPEEVAALGLPDYDEPGCVWLIEWPERGAGLLPQPDLSIELVGDAAGHRARLVAGTAVGARWMQSIE